MAETKGVLSLEKFCLKAVAEKIALHCKDSRQNGGLPYHDITFSRLGDVAIKEILDIAFSNEILSPEYFAVLIHKNVLKLDLSTRYQQLVTDEVLLQLRCKKLITLNLCGLGASTSCLNQMIQNLTSLSCINLSYCDGCSDSVLEGIAKNCPNLSDLNVEGCSQITDDGIEALLSATDSSVKPLKIAYLNVSSTSVTTASLWVLLNKLPLLLSLSFARIKGITKSPVNHIMFKRAVFPLQHLDMLDTVIEFIQLKELVESCPNFIKLILTIPSFANSHAEIFSESLKHLSKLKSLQLHTESIPEFEPVPHQLKITESLLNHIGSQLESIDITGGIAVNLSDLHHHCNSLKHLGLFSCQLVQPFIPSLETVPKKDHEAQTASNIAMFSNFCSSPLEYIHLEKVKFNGIPLNQKQELLYLLLASHPNLLQLSLKSVPIEQGFLIKILHSSSGTQLEKLVLSCYDNITAKTIRMIEESCPNLQHLELWHCWVITWSDIWQSNDRFKRNGRKLEVVAPEQNELIMVGC